MPSLHGFVPKFYRGGAIRFYLPLLYDLVAINKPRLSVTIGFDEGDAHFAFCQAAQEQRVKCRCVAIRRGEGKAEKDDQAWQKGKAYGEEFYAELTQFISGPSEEVAKDFAIEHVDLLLIDDCDSGSIVRKELAVWKSKLAPEAIVLVHGTQLEREDSPKTAWSEFVSRRPHLEFDDGLGLGLVATGSSTEQKRFLDGLKESKELYRLAADGMDAQARAAQIARENSQLETRLVWLDSVMADRERAQEIMDHQARALVEWEGKFKPLLRDREKAQEVMDHQAAVILDLGKKFDALQEDRAKAQNVLDHQARAIFDLDQKFEVLQKDRADAQRDFEALRRDRGNAQLVIDMQVEKLKQQAGAVGQMHDEMQSVKAQLKEQKKIIKAAKEACRKGARCFQIRTEPKVRRSILEKIVREQRRLLRQLGLLPPPPPQVAPKPPPAPHAIVNLSERYATWIREHESDAQELERQRRESARRTARPKISLLAAVYNTPERFLDEMLASVAAQTYDHWELCIVDGGSTEPGAVKVLKKWEAREPRFRIERLGKNLGIAENTNRALELSQGDFIACVDHDDLLAPFALYELAKAVNTFPGCEIFYSDEDRFSPEQKRHAPFFKPEWSPALLQSFMYLGHLTVYRRDLVTRVGRFRKEFDLSQDYDFALRASELAREVRHIPRVLYHWREHAASGSLGGKPNARASNLAALADAMRRRNSPAQIMEYPTANRARLEVPAWPRVSVVIPTDARELAEACATKLPRATEYPDWEIVLVTHSALAAALKAGNRDARIRFVDYDKPFNFSEKCNLGAKAATGERFIFFNDDVEPMQADWIQNLIEPLENHEVGAVAPKMLYPTGKIQHAGLVTGVRGLIGTAFHQRPADSTEHFNLAQSLRDVSALSAACLAMRRDDFFRVGGFDETNTPISHSDVDLCFKVREAGLRCVYTPFATLRHTGHASLTAHDEKNRAGRREKSSIYLLKRWAGYTMHDPYFPDNMRDWLFNDSPTPIRLSGTNQPGPAETSADLLFISHDLSASGAPMMLLYAAQWCAQNGFFVAVMSPNDGPLRGEFEAAGIPLILDPLVDTGHSSLVKFARNFDCVIANTVFSSTVVRALKKQDVPVMWWLHETMVGDHYLREDATLRLALPAVDLVVVPSTATAAVFQPFRDQPVKCLPNAIPDLNGRGVRRRPEQSLRFLVLGTVEPRKGQDVFVQALARLSSTLQDGAQFQITGRVMDPEFGERVKAIGASSQNLSIAETLSHDEALESLAAVDVVVLPSRDEAMPTVTMLEAMSLGKAIISTTVGGATEFLADGDNALLVKPEAAGELADAIVKLIRQPELVLELGKNARATYEKLFTMERFGARFCSLIEETLAHSKSGAPRPFGNL
jgi:O-antigen biosynthesis protein